MLTFSLEEGSIIQINRHKRNAFEGGAVACCKIKSILIGWVSPVDEVGRGEFFTEYVAILPPLDQVGRKVGGVTGDDEGIFRNDSHRKRMEWKDCRKTCEIDTTGPFIERPLLGYYGGREGSPFQIAQPQTAMEVELLRNNNTQLQLGGCCWGAAVTICTVVSACIRYKHCSLNLLVCTNGDYWG